MATSDHNDEFLSGRGIAVGLDELEDQLAGLWGPAVEQAAGPDVDAPAVTRVVLANLIVAGPAADQARRDRAVDAIAARYPSRIIMIRDDPDAPADLAAEVAALCHLPAPGSPQVCSERIALIAGPSGLGLVPAAVRSLLESELPTVLWWQGGRDRAPELLEALADEATRVLIDLPDPGTDRLVAAEAVDPSIHRSCRDLAWFGITRWREAIAGLFDPPYQDGPARIVGLRVATTGPPDSEAGREAVWLLAWLAGQWNWSPADRRAEGPTMTAEFRAQERSIPATIESLAAIDGAPIGVVEVELRLVGSDGPGRIQMQWQGGDHPAIRVEADCAPRCTLPRLAPAPDGRYESRVAAALESSRLDPPYDQARPIAAWLLGQPPASKSGT